MERYHRPLRSIFEVTQSEYDKVPYKIVLRKSIKPIQDTMGPNGLVTSLLLFSTLSQFPCMTSMNPRQSESFKALKLARAKM